MSQLPISFGTDVKVKVDDETIFRLYFLALAIIVTYFLVKKLM